MTDFQETGPLDPDGFPRIDGLVVRHPNLALDLGAIAALFAEINLHDKVDWIPSEASLRNDYEHLAGMDPARDMILVEAGGELIGAVDVAWRQRGDRIFHHIEPWVRPSHRRLGLGRALVDWAEAHVAAGIEAGSMGPLDRPHVLAGWADLEVAGSAELAAAAGYQVEGFGMVMIRSLADPIPDAPLPDGLEIRPVRPEDHRAIWDADAEAFQDHRDPGVRTDEDFEGWFTQPELDTSLWEVAWDGPEVAGSVMTFIYPEENEKLGVSRGWLEHVSVRRPWRRRGLASVLMSRSLQRLRDMGLAEALLGTDAENLSGAVRIYEALGFRRLRTAANYRKSISVPTGEASPPSR